MINKKESMFDKEGYIKLGDYLVDIFNMMKNGPWKLPTGIGDRWNLRLLWVVNRLSWLSSSLYIINPHRWSPSYSILYSFLHKKGFIDRVREINLPYDNYRSFLFEKDVTLYSKKFVVSGQGTDTSKENAFSKGLGEILERIVTGLGDMNKNVSISSYSEIEKKYAAVYPPKYHRYLKVQKETYRELNTVPEKSLEWVLGENLVTKDKTYIPKKLTLWFKKREDFKDILQNPTSNGCAGYFTREGATLRGLLEVVHRDSFFVHWLTTTAPEILEQETLPERIKQMISGFTKVGITIEILNTTSISVPSIIVVGISRQSEEPRIAISGAAAVTFEEAIIAGLTEMMSLTWIFMSATSFASEKKMVAPFISNLDMLTRRLYWQKKGRLQEFEWFLSGKQISFQEISKGDLVCDKEDDSKLKTVINVLKEMGEDYHPVVYCPINTIQNELGFYIAQVYIPKAFPLYLVEYQGTFDSDRLKEFADAKGKKGFKLNPIPHPFV